jgi:hypothetical protein
MAKYVATQKSPPNPQRGIPSKLVCISGESGYVHGVKLVKFHKAPKHHSNPAPARQNIGYNSMYVLSIYFTFPLLD